MSKFTPVAILLLGLLFAPLAVWGEMSGAGFLIYADSVNTGGDVLTGGVYSLRESTGESPVGFVTSTDGTYEVRGGFQAMERGELVFSASKNSVNLSRITANAVQQDSVALAISTDSNTGYTLSVFSATPFINSNGHTLAAVASGTLVTAGTEGYGLALSGNDVLFTSDHEITSGLSLASTSTPVVNSAVTMTFRAAASSATVQNYQGSYNQTIRLMVSANF